MKKKMLFAMIIALAALTISGAASEASVRNFGNFSIDMPDGWSENHSVNFISPNGLSGVVISTLPQNNAPLEVVARSVMMEMRGTDLYKRGDAYHFLFKTVQGFDGYSVVSANNDIIRILQVFGEHEDLNKIVNSLKP